MFELEITQDNQPSVRKSMQDWMDAIEKDQVEIEEGFIDSLLVGAVMMNEDGRSRADAHSVPCASPFRRRPSACHACAGPKNSLFHPTTRSFFRDGAGGRSGAEPANAQLS
jgi:hypothetical protein